MDEAEVRKTIELYLSTSTVNDDIEIAFFGGTFTGMSHEKQKFFLQIAKEYFQKGVKGIRLSTRPDYIDRPTLQLLKEYGVTSIELGAQSLDDEVLKLSGRGHNSQEVQEASELIHEYQFTLGLQMMLGLPGDTEEKAIETAKKIINWGAHETRIYPTLVIKNTELYTLYHAQKYKPLTLEESIDRLIPIVQLFEHHHVKILRLGLHPSKDLLDGDFVAGPWHPALKQIVKSKIFQTRIQNEGKILDGTILFRCKKSEIPYAVGYQKENVKHFNDLGLQLKLHVIE